MCFDFTHYARAACPERAEGLSTNGTNRIPLWQVVAGTTVGMLIANAPVIFLGARFAEKLPLRAARIGSAILFAALGLWILLR